MTTGLSLDGRCFRSAGEVEGGDVDAATLFTYHQEGDLVWAAYEGGGVRRGYLVGTRHGDRLDIRYCHLDASGATATGHCRSTVVALADGRLRLEERWRWESRDGSGTSVLEEVASRAAPGGPAPLLGEVDGRRPAVHATAWVAPGAVVVGDVRLGAEASVWYGAVLRGDAERIDVGEHTNVQDGCVLHADPGFPCVLEADVSLGHRAVVHGALVRTGALVGIGATVLNGARVGRNALVAAGAVVLPGTEVPDGVLVAGVPGKVRRDVTPDEVADGARRVAHYRAAAAAHRAATWLPPLTPFPPGPSRRGQQSSGPSCSPGEPEGWASGYRAGMYPWPAEVTPAQAGR